MQVGAITGYIDVAQVTLYVFWLFFFGLVFWLRREDKREGYPLVTEKPGERVIGFPPLPSPKTYLLPHGGTLTTPRAEAEEPDYNAVPIAGFPGAALQPLGNAMLSGTGPAAYALRAETPDLMWETGEPRIVPLRIANDCWVDPEGPDPRGMEVVGSDGVMAGVISDIWLDRAEMSVRYLEMRLAAGGSVLIPNPLLKTGSETVVVESIMGSQFVDAPRLGSPDVVTLREEDAIQAYFSSGHLYADPTRMEPLL